MNIDTHAQEEFDLSSSTRPRVITRGAGRRRGGVEGFGLRKEYPAAGRMIEGYKRERVI